MKDGQPLPSIGSRVLVQPAHIDPTIALHEVMHVVDQIKTDGQVIDTWPVNLRHW
jgi:D-serine deaminase-like pyridoxal phosphate-dependent protein